MLGFLTFTKSVPTFGSRGTCAAVGLQQLTRAGWVPLFLGRAHLAQVLDGPSAQEGTEDTLGPMLCWGPGQREKWVPIPGPQTCATRAAGHVGKPWPLAETRVSAGASLEGLTGEVVGRNQLPEC